MSGLHMDAKDLYCTPGATQVGPAKSFWCEQQSHHVRPPHGLAHAVQGLWGRPCQHEVLGCLNCANAVRARQVRRAVLLQASNDGGHKVRPKPGSTGASVLGTIKPTQGRQAPKLQPRHTVVATAHAPCWGIWKVEGCYNIRGGGKPGTWPSAVDGSSRPSDGPVQTDADAANAYCVKYAGAEHQ